MILRYRNTDMPNLTDLSVISLPTRVDGKGIRSGYTETWRVTGMVFGNTASEVNTAAAALKAAFAVDGGDLYLLNDDLTPTHQFILSGQTESGVQVKEGVNWPTGRGAEASTYRTFEVVLEAIVGSTVQSSDGDTFVFVETISTRGNGGPIRAVLQGQKRVQIQTVAQSSPYYATQSGMAVGKASWPQPPPPIWPDALQNPDMAITRKGPNRGGPPGFPTLTDFEISWDYQFTSTGPLTGNPTPPPF